MEKGDGDGDGLERLEVALIFCHFSITMSKYLFSALFVMSLQEIPIANMKSFVLIFQFLRIKLSDSLGHCCYRLFVEEFHPRAEKYTDEHYNQTYGDAAPCNCIIDGLHLIAEINRGREEIAFFDDCSKNGTIGLHWYYAIKRF